MTKKKEETPTMTERKNKGYALSYKNNSVKKLVLLDILAKMNELKCNT